MVGIATEGKKVGGQWPGRKFFGDGRLLLVILGQGGLILNLPFGTSKNPNEKGGFLRGEILLPVEVLKYKISEVLAKVGVEVADVLLEILICVFGLQPLSGTNHLLHVGNHGVGSGGINAASHS